MNPVHLAKLRIVLLALLAWGMLIVLAFMLAALIAWMGVR